MANNNSQYKNCLKRVRDNCWGIEYDICRCWFHLKCTNLSLKDYRYFCKTNDLWICLGCRTEIFPFQNINDTVLAELAFNSNEICMCSNNIINSRLRLDSLPRFEMSSLCKNHTLSQVDIDSQLPVTTSFDNFTPHDFHSSEEIRSCISENSFSALHFNIRSLAANFTSFCQLLDSLDHSFPIIGLSRDQKQKFYMIKIQS